MLRTFLLLLGLQPCELLKEKDKDKDKEQDKTAFTLVPAAIVQAERR